ncbi:MAG: hypothetical protein IPG28_12415 [Betaproteobacteria bacterium]|nr:hypothetical protein [Betaproteobacteria bacterium]MBK7080263.1 hypothetical protein [Betaproteobacteria bacterium]MBK7744879.1 hypothetical protein [Betaproteobacteria bacterium]MBK8687752.1 hypothetical protein [Betaproteobacteria bacterium]MBK9676123.1 hypothetical protein [Betaproteobacteria bacterium]
MAVDIVHEHSSAFSTPMRPGVEPGIRIDAAPLPPAPRDDAVGSLRLDFSIDLGGGRIGQARCAFAEQKMRGW